MNTWIRARFLPALVMGIAAGIVSCGSEPVVPFNVTLHLDQGLLYGCTSLSCSDYGLGCGATLSVRVVDAESLSGAALPGSDATSGVVVYASACQVVEAATDLCALESVDLTFDSIPTRRVQVQVALWEPPAEGEAPSCPGDIFNLQGIPIDMNPQPAFGGVAFIEAGTDAVADVALACRQPGLLHKTECLRTNLVNVRLDEMQSLALVPVQIANAPFLSVSIGEPSLNTRLNPPRWEITPANAFQMALLNPSPIPPLWKRADVPAFNETACVLVSGNVAQPTTVVTCTNDLSLETDGRLDVNGFVLPEPLIQELLNAANITGFPADGLVIGRVLDSLGAPISGVTVRPQPDVGVNVEYINAARDSATIIGPTSSDGFFISRNAPFNTRWQASDNDGRVQSTDQRAGLITGKISMVVIEMTDP